MNKTLGTFYTGGGLFDIGAEMAGYTSIWGFEYDDKIASVARRNNLPVVTFDLRKITKKVLKKYARPNHFHVSPPCPSFSNAKQGGVETPDDLLMADAVCLALEYYLPDTFSLENVPAYVHSQSWGRIYATLIRLGYFVDAQNINAADYQVPQTRNRFWCRASRGLLMQMPEKMPWVGWYQAIEDLIPELPDSEFAPWQIARLPKEYLSFITQPTSYNKNTQRGEIFRKSDQPAHTVLVQNSSMKAMIIGGGGNTSFAEAAEGKGFRDQDEPAMTQTVAGTPGKIRAFVLDGQANGNGDSVTVRDDADPVFTIAASENQSGGSKRAIRAFVLNGSNANSRTFMPRDDTQPHHTVTASIEKTPSKAYIGRVVKMNIKALGRFQTVPDWYQGLTPKINGNGVPCKLAKIIMETL